MLLSAFILGLVGSLHCAGMCGPLALALPVAGPSRTSFILSRITYNAGRVLTYTLIGAGFGMAGETLRFAGFQRWLSLSAGLLLVAGLAFSAFSGANPAALAACKVKALFGKLLRQKSYPALLALGATNGLLPCGLVYVAGAAAVATGHIAQSAAYMFAFGFGTLPVMLAVPILGRTFQWRLPIRRLIPVSTAIVALLLILRGLSLGVPYLSPDLSSGAPHCPACH